MRKKVLSLCMALVLCLGLLPVTALAAAEGAPSQLYVGNQQVSSGNDITYWTTDTSGGLVSASESDSWNVKYNPNTATLTLRGATIQGGSTTESAPFGSGIYALGSSGQPVALTIELIGENTITGTFGIYVNATPPTTPGTDASLVIKKSGDNGSLTVTGTGNSGLHIISGTGDASLTIKNASVDAKTTQTYSSYAGVCVQSGASATGSPQLSLAVNGGSLTASGTGSRDGILFYVGSSNATGATTSLTVSENAIVDARNGGISAKQISNPINTDISATSSNGGIVFDGTEGTVYGDVTLEDNLTIGEDESLTIPDGASLNTDGKLTNEGTINVESGGSVSGKLSDGTTITTPTINAPPQDKKVQAGSTAEFSVTASDAQTYQWQQKATDTGSEWEDISNATTASYTTAATTTDMSGYQYRCVVKSASGVSVISQTATLTVQAKPTYTVTVNASPTEGGSVKVNGSGTSATVTANSDVTLTATANEGYRFTGWMENDQRVSTDATYTFKATGDRTLTAKFEKKVTGVTLDKETLELYTGDTATLTATVEPSDAANQNVTWQSDNANVATVQNGTVTAVGAGETTISVTTEDGSFTATCTITVEKPYTPPPYIPPTKTPSQQAIDKIEDAKEGSTVKITLRTGQTKLDKEVFEELAGRDVTLEISLPGGVTWTVNGEDIPKTADLTDLDMGVSLNTSTIPVDLINAITGEIGTVQLTLKHDGPFGFTMTLTAPVGKENEGLWANLYHYDEDAGEMVYQTAAQVDEDGNVALPFDHASQYALVLDSKSHDLPFTDLAANAWYTDAVAYVYRHDIMEGMSATTFQPNGTLSRAMAAQILYNLEGQPDISGENLGYPYEDVNAQAWYGDAVYWARITGVATGYGDGTFQPTDSITRQEFAQMLYNYAKYKGYDLTAEGDLSQFPDSGSVADWAKVAMSWANGNKLINGHDDGTIDAAGTAIRAQAASILMRFDQNLVEK